MIDSVIISRALQQTSKLTLPNFGTLLKKDSGEIVFSQFLKNDDMVFSSIVMNSYNVSAQEASHMVLEFISDIVAKISNGGYFKIPEIGFLVLDKSGSIKLKKEEPVITISQPQPQQLQQPRQSVSPRPIMGIPQQQPIANIPPRYASNNQQQFRQQSQSGPRIQRVPQRPQGIPQRPQPRMHPQPGSMSRPQYPQNGMGRPVERNSRPKKKSNSQNNDFWIVIAIIVISISIALIVYSTFFAETVSDLM